MFDLLYLNGMSLLHKSLKFRKRNLRSCLQEVPGRIEFVSEREGKTAKDVRARMEEIMAGRVEQLVELLARHTPGREARPADVSKCLGAFTCVALPYSMPRSLC